MVPSFLDKSLIPHSPGVYIYKNSSGKIIYVGKAIDLYHRVSSYFSGYEEDSRRANVNHIGSLDTKTALLVKQIASVETIIVESELEALILEANLIKKFLPEFNIRLTDDKDYLYIKITKGDFPQIITARKKELYNSYKYFGPFPSSRTVKDTLKSLRKIFPWCSKPPKLAIKDRLKPCFYYHLGLCPGACIGLVSSKDYKKIIFRFSKFLSGQKKELLDELSEEMQALSKDLRFEAAQQIKKIILGIEYLTQPNRVTKYLENPNFLENEKNEALNQLKRDLNLKRFPERIEAYDISNIQGKLATGSMVVLTNGEIDKSQYRRFSIKSLGKANDVAMHKEMMQRRLKHPDWPHPQVFLIDGGIAQVRAAYDVISSEGLDIQVFGLAKRMEWLYTPDGEIIKLSKHSLSLRLLQKVRDEAHRFALSYHRKLRSKT